MSSERNYHVKTLSKHKLTVATTSTLLKMGMVRFKNFSTISANQGSDVVSYGLNP